MADKTASMRTAIAELVRDGDTVAIEGFTHLICFAAGHEIIRQGRRDLTLCRLTPDVIYDQMIGAGVARKLVFSWLGNPGVGSLHAIRRRIEHGDPKRIAPTGEGGAGTAPGELESQFRSWRSHAEPLEVEEYSHFGMVSRYVAGASGLPFMPLRSYFASDLPKANGRIVPIESPYGDGPVYAVPPLNPDVAIVHVQRADADGNAQIWGFLGCQKETAFAATRVIIVCEEIVESAVIRADPNRTVIPGLIVDAVVEEPRACHPSFAQGYYDRDNRFYVDWDPISRDSERLDMWLKEWVHGCESHAAYVDKLGEQRWSELTPAEAWSEPVNYGMYE